ncbi:MAG: hypothetical protein QOI53_2973 [Verrucomicrobiota bacterium]|nr:hypothetical protein [Verrucomicrobiota bacterium]
MKCPCFGKAREMIPGFCLCIVSLFLPSKLLLIQIDGQSRLTNGLNRRL